MCSLSKKASDLNSNEKGESIEANTSDSDVSYNADSRISKDEENLDSRASPEPEARSQREIDLEEMLDGLKTKFSSLDRNDPLRVRILTISPSSWSTRKIAKEFNASRYLVEKSKRLKSMNGVLSETVAKAGRSLSQETVKNIEEFYNNDMYSRIMSSKKDVVSVKNKDGAREEKRKRLLLLNMKELYSCFKETHPKIEISFSKFAFLRPKYCILPGASGTHSVCVCTIHQNMKLMLDAINLKQLTENTSTPLSNYKDCIEKMVCSNPTSDCYISKCNKFPGTEKIISVISKQLEDSCISDIKYSSWTDTDRATLTEQTSSVEDYLLDLDNKLNTLKVHSYIAKQQIQFINEKKILALMKYL